MDAVQFRFTRVLEYRTLRVDSGPDFQYTEWKPVPVAPEPTPITQEFFTGKTIYPK